MNKAKRRHVPLWQAIALWLILAGFSVAGFASLFGALSHDESHEREDIRKAMQELHNKRKQ